MNTPRLHPLTLIFVIFAILIFADAAFGQSSQPEPSPHPQPTSSPSLEKKFLSNILRDQRAIWTAPFKVKHSDGKWLAPLGIATAVFVATDRHTSGELFEGGDHRRRISISKDFSRLGSTYATGGVAAAFYFAGRVNHNAREKETGLLAAEALIDSGIVVTALKTAAQRPRPPVDHASGEFFDGGASFPSGHATNSWALAAVVASEYGQHRPLVRFGVYGIAAAVSLSRYTGTNHFLSDVLVGSALGYGIGRYVYHNHHDRSLDVEASTTKRNITQSKLFPLIAPSYARGHISGATLSWSF